MNKKRYIKPEVVRIELDYTISIQMQSQPHDPPPRNRIPKNQGVDNPFKSPFGDKPFQLIQEMQKFY